MQSDYTQSILVNQPLLENNLIMSVTFKKGTQRYKAIFEAWRVAVRLDCIVAFEFNEHNYKIDPHLDITLVVDNMTDEEKLEVLK